MPMSAKHAPEDFLLPSRGLPNHFYGTGIVPIQAFPLVLEDLGCDARQIFARAKVDLRLFDDPTRRISFNALGRLVEESIAATGCQHFGLLIGQRFNLDGMGDIRELMRNSATLGKACRSLVRHLHLQDRGAVPLLLPIGPTRMALGYSVLRHETPAIKHIHDGGLTIVFRLLKEICGADWKPPLVQFSYSRPADITPYQKFFGTRVSFDAGFSAVVLATESLAQPIERADPIRHELLAARIAERENSDQAGLADKVRRALQSMVFSGTASTDGIAHLFEVNERTLRRKLDAEGTSVQQLIQEATSTVAQQLLRETELSIAEIAAALYYNDTAAFSNAFRRWVGRSPNQWRKSVRGAAT